MSTSPLRILVTGAGGFIGSHLTARLKAEGHSVIGARRGARNWGRASELDLVINCAGQLDDPDQMVSDNVAEVFGLLEAAREFKLPRIIHLGSSSETGPREGPRREDDGFFNPTDLYEATKGAATLLCLGYARQYGMNVSVVRPFSIYGPGDKPRKLLPTLWHCWTQDQPFTCYPGGHDWVHIDDFVEGVLAVMAAPEEATRGQVFNLGTGVSTSNAEVVSLFNHHVGGAGVRVTHVDTPYRAYDVMDWRADPTKAREQLGWSARIPLSDGIRQFVHSQWFASETAPGL